MNAADVRESDSELVARLARRARVLPTHTAGGDPLPIPSSFQPAGAILTAEEPELRQLRCCFGFSGKIIRKGRPPKCMWPVRVRRQAAVGIRP